MHYLDYNATSPLHPNIKQSMIDAMDIFGNPSSVHSYGRKAKSILENAREKAAQYLGVLPHNIIFTGSATEANHLLFRGLECDAIITSRAEHDAVLSAIDKTNADIYYIAHKSDGALCQDSFDKIKKIVQEKHQAPLLSLMKVNNETGTIQDLSYFAEKIREIGGLVHSDAVQALGKIPFDSWAWQCDSITLAAHKVGGPKSVGILMIKDRITLDPLLTGGGQEMRRRAGTENLVNIHGFGALLDLISQSGYLQEQTEKLSNYQNFIETTIFEKNPNAIIVGRNHTRVANTMCVITQGIEAEKQVIIADLNKVSLSSGAACSSGKVKPSHVLEAYNYPEVQAKSAIRVSTGFLTTQNDCDALICAYEKILSKVA